jgi:hypothetical protein
MAEILGLTITDYPRVRHKPQFMAASLQGLMDRGWVNKPHLKDVSKWPAPMREMWGDDRGKTAGEKFVNHQIEQFRKIKKALDQFKPDFGVVLYRDHREPFPNNRAVPQYWIQAHDEVKTKLYTVQGRPENYFDEDPDKIDTIPGHRKGALHLVRKLQDAGFNAPFMLDPLHPNGLSHNMCAVSVHLDWDKRDVNMPLIPFAVDPFGFLRTRNAEGLSPWIKENPRPLLPKEAFELGRSIARIYRDSPWRVALIAGVDWSHANESAWEFERMHPDVQADLPRFEQWKSNKFDKWGDNWTFDEMEQHAQWELLVTIILAGAMTEIGSKVVYSDFQAGWTFNDDFVTTLFEPK